VRRLRLLAWPAGAALGLLAEWTAYGVDDLGHTLPDLVTGWTLLACGLLVWGRRPESRTGILLALTGASWFGGNFAAALLYLHRGPLVHALLAYPSGRAGAFATRVAVATAYVVATAAPVWESEAATLVLSAALGALAAVGYREAVGAERRARGTSLAGTLAVALVLGVGAAARLAFPGGDADEPALLAYEFVLCALAIGLSARLISRSWERTALADLVVELGESRSETLRDAFAGALGDPTLEVGFWVPDSAAYLDADGHKVTLPESGSGRSVTLVEREGKPLAALVHDPVVLDDPLLVDAVAAAARLAASNAQLQVELRAQVAELEASRRRLVAAGDDERRRLERRLHDGVERRLAALADTLEQARTMARDGTSDRVAHAQEVLARTRRDLRELARGLHPASLSDAGLAGALAELAEASVVPVELSVCDGRVDPEVEAVAYFVCAEALANVTKHASATRAALAVHRRDGRLRIEINDDGAGGADLARGTGLRGLADRVEACGGSLSIESPPGRGTRLVAAMPLDAEAR
jgi:signal transduction histidine kinase